jgi:hypothetical protein
MYHTQVVHYSAAAFAVEIGGIGKLVNNETHLVGFSRTNNFAFLVTVNVSGKASQRRMSSWMQSIQLRGIYLTNAICENAAEHASSLLHAPLKREKQSGDFS